MVFLRRTRVPTFRRSAIAGNKEGIPFALLMVQIDQEKPFHVMDLQVIKPVGPHMGRINLARVREAIDVPPSLLAEVISHRIFQGWCAQCQKWQEAPVDLHTQVFGQGRLVCDSSA
jgi:hypothetical protein